ncbi:MAG: hypothetical protein AAGE52_41935 [Myxococcota bacterium]
MPNLSLPLLSAVIALALGCGSAATGPTTSEPLTPDRLYPLEQGLVWSYNVDTGDDTPPTLAISQIVGAEGNRFEVQNNRSEVVVYERRPEGIWRVATETYLLRTPIEEGAEWAGPSGRTMRIAAMNERVETTSQTFEGCVRVEEGGGADRRTIVTVYCPDVGPVMVESSMQAQLTGRNAAVRAVLLGYGSTEAP